MASIYPIHRWLEHIHWLSEEIGPRGSTTESERRGSEYCAQILQQLKISPQIEEFKSARSTFFPHFLTGTALVLSFAVYPWLGRTSAAIAAILSIVAMGSELLELSARNNLLRWMTPKASSQNVVAVIPPSGDYHQDLVLIGHVDSQRTPLIFKNARWLAFYQSFTTIAFALFLAEVGLFVLGTITQWEWIWPASGISAFAALLLAALCGEADLTPYTRGANDNASGSGLVLTMAEHLLAEPLQTTRTWLVCTGCEEAIMYGAEDFFKRHASQLRNPKVVVLDSIGCAGPAWLEKEGIVIPFHPDPTLVKLAADLAQKHPELCAYPTHLTGAYTEMAVPLRLGIPAISFVGNTPEHSLPYWHTIHDTYDKLKPEVMERVYAFTWAFIRALD